MDKNNQALRNYIEELALRSDRHNKEGRSEQSEELWRVIAELESMIN